MGGRRRGYRNMYYATGVPGWARGGYNPGWAPTAAPPPEQFSPEDYARAESEKEMLERQAHFLKQQLEALNQRLEALEAEEE